MTTKGKNNETLPATRRKRFWIPIFLLALLPCLVVFLWFRGTTVRDLSLPASADQGTRCGIDPLNEGSQAVTCARIVNKPLQEVWQTITRYNDYTTTFKHLSSAQAYAAGPDQWVLEGVATMTGRDKWPFRLTLLHRFSAEQAMVLWQEPAGEKIQSRGFWRLTALPDGQTRVEYKTSLVVPRCPQFLANNVLLHEIPRFLEVIASK